MGRPKLILKPIPNGRDRDLALMKRKKGLIKKMSEFCTVCGVKACLIMYDGNGDAQPLTWPQDPVEVHSIIEMYEGMKNEKLPKNFDLNNFFDVRKNMVEIETSKVQKEILKIKYPTWHPSFNALSLEELRNFIARLDIMYEACNQRIELSKHNRQIEANFNFMQCMVQPENAVPNPSQLNFMQGMSQNQLIFAPMNPLNDGNLVASFLLDKSYSSQSPMLNFDPNLMQLTARNEGVVAITNQVDVPLDCAYPNDAFGNSTNQLGVPVDLTNLVDQSLDYFSHLGELDDLNFQHGGVVNWASQPDESMNWTNQHGVPVIGRSTTSMNGATNHDTIFYGDEHNNSLSSLWNYNGGMQSMQPYNYDDGSQNIPSQSENVLPVATLPTLLPSVDEFQTDHYNNMLQNQLSNHII